MSIEQLERNIQLAIQAHWIDFKILNEKASELWDENERLKENLFSDRKMYDNTKMIIKIDQEIQQQRKELSEYIKKNLKEIEELETRRENNKADFIEALYNDFSSEDTARKRLYKKLGIEE